MWKKQKKVLPLHPDKKTENSQKQTYNIMDTKKKEKSMIGKIDMVIDSAFGFAS